LKRGFKTESERRTTSLRNELGLQPKVPLYARTLARHMGIPVITPNEIQGLTQEDRNELCGRVSSNWSALTLVTPRITFIIHNPTHSAGSDVRLSRTSGREDRSEQNIPD
jgi:hypothetical protein